MPLPQGDIAIVQTVEFDTFLINAKYLEKKIDLRFSLMGWDMDQWDMDQDDATILGTG